MKMLCTFLLLIGYHFLMAQATQVVFYNVENLFDTLDTPKKKDGEFLPTGKKEWTSDRYLEKINHIHQVMTTLSNIGMIGLAEIENENVLNDLLTGPYSNLKYVHQESLDERGIDVALLYDPKIFELQKSSFIRFDTLQNGRYLPRRDILCAEFTLKRQLLYVLVNHWPSRRGGETQSEPYRLQAARFAKRYIDSILQVNPEANILFMGDLNDFPENQSVQLIRENLVPMISKESGSLGGTNEYKGRWNVLDHILVSKSMLTENDHIKKKKGIHIETNSGTILEATYLLSKTKGKTVPFRTYSGKYLGGYSDHLPVYITITY